MSPADSVAIAHGANFVTKGGMTINNKGLSPYRVVKSLPASATEVQKDSAVQANFNPGRIDYNTRIDTLTTFGVKVVKVPKLSEVNFREEGYFKGNKYFHPELGISRNGVVGTPAPYALSNDDTITGLLLGCFILACIAISGSLGFVWNQIKNFFYMPRRAANVTETPAEVRFQIFLMFQTALLSGIIYYLYSNIYKGYFKASDYQLLVIGVFSGIISAYFAVKLLVYNVVGWVFFSKEKNLQWNRTTLFLNSVEGVCLFPAVMLLAYFGIDMPTAVIYSLTIVLLVKILTFYKSYAIFFRKTGAFLQNFLYFCALELVPVVALYGVLTLTGNYLTIIF